VQVVAMPHQQYGQLLHDYAVAFAGHLLLRSAPLCESAESDERLVRTFSRRRADCMLKAL